MDEFPATGSERRTYDSLNFGRIAPVFHLHALHCFSGNIEDIAPPAAMDCSNSPVVRIMQENGLAVRLLNEQAYAGLIGYEGIISFYLHIPLAAFNAVNGIAMNLFR